MNDNQKKEFYEKDLYKLFNIDENSTTEQIKKAYRKKALELHPDKNLDNKEEAEKKFIELGKIFEILSDEKVKAAYDAVRRNRKQRQEKLDQLDNKTKKFKKDLEARENAAKIKSEEDVLKREIERLRKEGSKLLEEEMNKINEEIRAKKNSSMATNDVQSQPARLKVKWRKTLDTELIKYLFEKYGELDIFLISEKKTDGIIEYKNIESAQNAFNDKVNLHTKYDITVQWIGPVIKTTVKEEEVKKDERKKAASLEELEAEFLRDLQKI